MDYKPLGVSPVDFATICVTFGAGKPLMYAETGTAVSSLMGHKIQERHFRPRFVDLCGRGLVTFQNWDQMFLDIRARKVVEWRECVDIIREVNIVMGGDFSYYKYFDPYADYEKNPEKMDRFLNHKVAMGGRSRKIHKQDLYEQHWKNHLKDPKKFRWN